MSVAAKALVETAGPTVLTLGVVADGELLIRSGTTIIGSAGGGGGAPTNASYVVIGLNGALSDERVLAAGTGLLLADGGAGGNATLSPDFGSGAGKVTEGNDARLSDDRVPLPHAGSHGAAGLDPLLLSDLGAAASFVRFNQQQANQMCIHNLTADPASPVEGQIWLRTDL